MVSLHSKRTLTKTTPSPNCAWYNYRSWDPRMNKKEKVNPAMPTWWASTPMACRADLKNSGEGFPTTSASIPQAYWQREGTV